TLINAAYVNSGRGLLFKRQALNIGDSCIRDTQCASGICSGTCKDSDNRPDGERCEVNEACGSQNCDRFCFTPKDNGQSCGGDSECVSSICSSGTCKDSDDRPAGERCKVKEACESKNCDRFCVGIENSKCGLDIDCGSLVCRKSDNTCQSLNTREDGIECAKDAACKSSICVDFSECRSSDDRGEDAECLNNKACKKFGDSLRLQLLLDDPFNNGLYGTYNKPVRETLCVFQDRSEFRLDQWMCQDLESELTKAREAIAKFFNAVTME
ncbi:7284_t:CDS:2, partial [Entrophospora sp. SA101]